MCFRQKQDSISIKFNVSVSKSKDFGLVKKSICLFFFFIDKDILEDSAMDHVNNITLSYTFFKTGQDEEEEEEESEKKTDISQITELVK
mmetsp:Transcript_42185/g.54328  ORF Transcript_42185/g.54328 Transcript_42185/m.54328 type:complete len:89 (+) Transcript_42185:506-772(+)